MSRPAPFTSARAASVGSRFQLKAKQVSSFGARLWLFIGPSSLCGASAPENGAIRLKPVWLGHAGWSCSGLPASIRHQHLQLCYTTYRPYRYGIRVIALGMTPCASHPVVAQTPAAPVREQYCNHNLILFHCRMALTTLRSRHALSS